MADFGERLRMLRRERDLGQKEVAAWLSLSQSSIGKYEHGERTPTPGVVKQLAEKFNVSTDFLLGNTDMRTPNLGEPNIEFTQMLSEWKKLMEQKKTEELSLEQERLLNAYGKAPEAIQEAVRNILKPYEQ